MTLNTIKIATFAVALLVSAFALRSWLASHDEQQRLQATLATQKEIINAADVRERTRDATLNQALAQIEKLKRATQTPEQVVRDLPKYLPLPEPITLVNNAASDGAAATSKSGAMRGRVEVSESVAPFAMHGAIPPSSSANPDASEPLPLQDSRSPETSQSRNASLCPTPEQCAPEPASVVPTSQSPQKSFDGLRGVQPLSPNARSSLCPDGVDCSAEIPAADLKPLYNYVQDCRACELQLAAAKQNATDAAARMAHASPRGVPAREGISRGQQNARRARRG